jgi:hypothetical protein
LCIIIITWTSLFFPWRAINLLLTPLVVICPCLALKEEDDVGVVFPGAGWVLFALEIHFSRDFAGGGGGGWGNARVVVWGDYLPTTTTTTNNNNNINSNIQTMSC